MKLHPVYPPSGEMGTTGPEPTWTAPVAENDYQREMMRGLNWHNYCADRKNWIRYIEEWVKYKRTDLLKYLPLWKNVPDSWVSGTHASLARMQLQGFPLRAEDEIQIVFRFLAIVAGIDADDSRSEKDEPNRPSVQDHMRQQVTPILSDLDALMDDAFDGKRVDYSAFRDRIKSLDLKAPQFKMIERYLTKHLTEWRLAFNKEDEQLAEGYAYLTAQRFQHIINGFDDILSMVTTQIDHKKVTRMVKKRPVDKKKLVAKLKFLKQSDELGLTSIDPTDILGANVLWVYDTQKRKLGRYEAEFPNGIFAKGTTILGVKESFQKTLRKPEEQLAEFKKLRKNQTAKWFETIKAKGQALNGRTNPNLILLKVE